MADFWSRVDQTGDCWIWQQFTDSFGYGQYKPYHRGKTQLAHRAAYELVKGPIPKGLVIDHLCSNPPCVRPEHLEAVTQHENLLRSNNWVGTQARQTHCKWGHEFNEANTYRWSGRPTRRGCRICRSAASQRHQEVNRG